MNEVTSEMIRDGYKPTREELNIYINGAKEFEYTREFILPKKGDYYINSILNITQCSADFKEYEGKRWIMKKIENNPPKPDTQFLKANNVELTGEIRVPKRDEYYVGLDGAGTILDIVKCEDGPEPSFYNGKRYIVRKIKRKYTFTMEPTREELDEAVFDTDPTNLEYHGKNMELTGECRQPEIGEFFATSYKHINKCVVSKYITPYNWYPSCWILRKKTTIQQESQPTINEDILRLAIDKVLCNTSKYLQDKILEEYTQLVNKQNNS